MACAGAAVMAVASTRVAILAGLAVACQALIFPPVGAAWLAWLAPLPVFLLFPLRRIAAGVAVGWAIGTLQALLINAPWLWPAMRAAIDLPSPILAAMLVFEAQIIGGLPFALLGLCLQVAAVRLPLPAFTLFAPAAWVAAEYSRSWLPLGAPWALLGSALSSAELPIQVADLGGVYAVSFAAALPSAALAQAVAALRSGRPRGALPGLVLAATLLGVTFLYGARRLSEIAGAMAVAPSLRVALVHAELADDQRLAPSRAPDNVTRSLGLTQGFDTKVDLVIWPENTVAALLEENPDLVARIAERATDAVYLVGGPRIVAGPPRSLRASVFLVGPRGIEGFYDKRRLLPAGETAHTLGGRGWRDTLGFAPGDDAPLLEVRGRPLGLTICYEAVFPELTRSTARAGAALLVNVSNDSWFAGAGPDLHFLLGRLRAVETRRSVVRAANGGITALMLPNGRIAASDRGRPGVLVTSAPLLDEMTLYTRAGDWFAWLCVGSTVLGLVLSAFADPASRARRVRKCERGAPRSREAPRRA